MKTYFPVVVKLKKKNLNGRLSDLMYALDLVFTEEGTKQAHPERAYFSKEDIKTLHSNIRKLAKKDFPGASKKRLDNVVAMEDLNLGPNRSLDVAIRPGYAIVMREREEE
jgi:hypothetical protein